MSDQEVMSRNLQLVVCLLPFVSIVIYACSCFNIRFINISAIRNSLNKWGICISRPRPFAWPTALALAPSLYLPALAPKLCLPALAPNLYLPVLAPNLCLPALAPNFYLPALVSPKPGLADTNLVPPICIYWPWPTILLPCSEFAFIFLSIVVAVAAVLLAIVVVSQDYQYANFSKLGKANLSV